MYLSDTFVTFKVKIVAAVSLFIKDQREEKEKSLKCLFGVQELKRCA